MAMTPEKRVKEKIVRILKKREVYYFFPATHGFGRSGVPDIIICHRGHFLAIEVKAGKNITTQLQEREIRLIRESGGTAVVVNETNVDAVDALLDAIEVKYAQGHVNTDGANGQPSP